MNQTERRRFTYINSVMSEINSITDDIYEGLADNDVDGVISSIRILMSVCKDLQESISDDTPTKTDA